MRGVSFHAIHGWPRLRPAASVPLVDLINFWPGEKISNRKFFMCPQNFATNPPSTHSIPIRQAGEVVLASCALAIKTRSTCTQPSRSCQYGFKHFLTSQWQKNSHHHPRFLGLKYIKIHKNAMAPQLRRRLHCGTSYCSLAPYGREGNRGGMGPGKVLGEIWRPCMS